MPDMEKTIKCLEACTGATDDCAGHTCPYWNFDDSAVGWGCRIQMEKDALELLKEQETDIGNLNETVKNLLNVYTEIKAIYGDSVRVVGELVRCKDCKYAEVPILNYFKNTHCYCEKYELTKPKDWFCADGIRRKEENR